MATGSDSVNATPRTGRRETYRHGNLRAALVAEGLGLARRGGPQAVGLRAVTRRAGVASNAAYRHFADRDALVSAVSLEAQRVVAAEMTAEIASGHDVDGGEAERATSALAAIGRAYVRFALREPGLFETAFSVHQDLAPARAVEAGPYALLSAALDRCVAAGAIEPAGRQGAEVAAWASVHGLAELLLHGPLRSTDEAGRDAMIERVLRMVVTGL